GDGTPDNQDPDIDGDGVNNKDEEAAGTDPTNPDSDGNGTPDGDEDADKDGIPNKDESDPNGTTPTDKDDDGKPDITTPKDTAKMYFQTNQSLIRIDLQQLTNMVMVSQTLRPRMLQMVMVHQITKIQTSTVTV